MLTKDISIASLAGALIFCTVVGSAGVDAYKAMKAKAIAQEDAVIALREWKRQYNILIPVEERWTHSLGRMEDAKDLLTIHGLVSAAAPKNDADALIVEKIQPVKESGKDLGAQSVCISSGGRGWVLSEATFPELMAGLQKLTGRVDMTLGAITLTQEKGAAQAVVEDACLLLREDSAPRNPVSPTK